MAKYISREDFEAYTLAMGKILHKQMGIDFPPDEFTFTLESSNGGVLSIMWHKVNGARIKHQEGEFIQVGDEND